MGGEIVAAHQNINMFQDWERFHEILDHNPEALIFSNPSQADYMISKNSMELLPHKYNITIGKGEYSIWIVLRNEHLSHRESLKRMYAFLRECASIT